MAKDQTPALFELPDNLESEGLVRFDRLVAEGKIFYEEPTWKSLEDEGCRVNFVITPALARKPILSKNEQAPAQAKRQGPFIDPDPDFVLTSVGPDHTLVFNKYCVTRPMYLLHTKEYQPQRDALTDSDLKAICSLFSTFDANQNMVFFNCGADAGASQGHKHFQMFGRPAMGVMFPDDMHLSLDEVTSCAKVPFKNFVIGLEADITVSILKSKYIKLMDAMNKACNPEGRVLDYNLILVKTWLAMIPRRHAGLNGQAQTNSAGMAGMICVKDEAEMNDWKTLGVAKHLAYLGIAA